MTLMERISFCVRILVCESHLHLQPCGRSVKPCERSIQLKQAAFFLITVFFFYFNLFDFFNLSLVVSNVLFANYDAPLSEHPKSTIVFVPINFLAVKKKSMSAN